MQLCISNYKDSFFLIVDHKQRHCQNRSGRTSWVDEFFETHLTSFDNITSNLNLHFHLTFIFSLQNRHKISI